MRFYLVCSALLWGAIASAQDWAGFRGSFGNGTTTQTSTPTKWDATTGIRWSVDLPSGGNGSPIVVGDRVFVTSAEDSDGKVRSLVCFDADSGQERWKRSVDFGKKMPTHKTNPYSGTTPTSNGKQVVVWHGSAGLFAYNIDGDELWSHDLGEYRHLWGYGTSPVIVGDRVMIHSGPGKQVFVVAFDLASGKELWRHEEPVDGNGQRNGDDQYMGSWSTPVLMDDSGKQVAVCAFATRVCGLDAATGEVLWFCPGLSGPKGDLAYSSPMIQNKLCVMVGGFKGPAIGFQIKGTGDIVEHRLWRNAGNPQNIGTGVLKDGYLYRVGAGPNFIECIEAKTNKLVWQERWGAAFWSSISHDGTNAYATDQRGTTVVFRLTPESFQPVASNPLVDTCNATPALAKNRVYVRTYKKLWCIEAAK